ncbi:hypothetical protein [Variovorax sp. EBFNA2]|uniref:hypothetical protein n=1 Tax=Variovorax sp. EBFNA2 TaxID=3342097 RepID=UPI0029C05DA8|nr:hypothetical protein [Variovorax boronicumulans]WPG34985.1 hypothetical protein RZE79_15930 [Variovorax boronicumulans]
MASTLRTPPRFVPTLTTVLEIPAEPVPVAETPRPTGAPVSQPAPPDPASVVALPPSVSLTPAEIVSLEEQLLHRVLQRVDLSLEERLSDAVSAAVQHQLDEMVPRLRGEIEAVLRALVIESMAAELCENTGENTGSTPASGA